MADLPPDQATNDDPERPSHPGAPIAWLTVGVGVVMALLLALVAWATG